MSNVDALSPSARSIFAETLKWPVEQRVALIERLLASFEKTDPSVDLAWLIEAESRLAAYRAGELLAIDAEQALSDP
jgi:hypothetical protein